MRPEEWDNAFQWSFLEGFVSKNWDVICFLMYSAGVFSLCVGWDGLLHFEDTGQNV